MKAYCVYRGKTLFAAPVRISKSPKTYDKHFPFSKLIHKQEQFTAEWDAVDPLFSMFPLMVAGNYGAHTNVWGIALTLICLITKAYPHNPPRLTPWKQGPVEYDTYGGFLEQEEYRGTDPELRRILMLCLTHRPLRRLDLPTLDQIVETNCERAFPGLDDDGLRRWMHDILHEPSPDDEPGPPVEEAAGRAMDIDENYDDS